MTVVAFEDIKPKLLTLDEALGKLSMTEPLAQHVVDLSSGKTKFKLNTGWNVGLKNKAGTAPVDAHLQIGAVDYNMTKDAVLEATSHIGLTRQYVEKTPASLVEPHLNYWFANTDKELKVLATTNGTALAFTKATINPFSNLKLVNAAVAAIKTWSDNQIKEDDIYVDYKFHHDLRLTRVRLIIPADVRTIGNAQWSTGIQIQNSLTGAKPTSLKGYLFTWDCTNGQISTHATSGNWNRKTSGQADIVYEWAESAVEEVLGGLEHEFESVQELADTPLDQPLDAILMDIFQTYSVPMGARKHIIQALIERQVTIDEPLTFYDIQWAITAIANTSEEDIGNVLMEIGGDLVRSATHRCSECKRIALDA